MSELNIYGVGDSIFSSDYIGFSFNGVHSSELGIKRISEGSRFNENLLPTIQDKTIQVPGGDGMYYFGSYYTQRQFSISYAFDSLTEQQLNRIKAVFGDKKPHRLVFDEVPYKAYLAKVTGSASIKHIPFAEGATNRVYKGEGNIQFTAYEPFARSVHKYLEEFIELKGTMIEETTVQFSRGMGDFTFTDWNMSMLSEGRRYRVFFNGEEYNTIATNQSEVIYIKEEDWPFSIEYNISSGVLKAKGTRNTTATIKIEWIETPQNIQEWEEAAKLLANQGSYDKLVNNYIELYNPGDKETDYICILNFQNGVIPSGEIKILDGDIPVETALVLKEIKAKRNDSQIRINTKLNLIEGYEYRSTDGKYIKSSTLYNDCISSGGFTKIPKTFDQFDLSKQRKIRMYISSSLGASFEKIEYDYLYY